MPVGRTSGERSCRHPRAELIFAGSERSGIAISPFVRLSWNPVSRRRGDGVNGFYGGFYGRAEEEAR